MQANLVKKSVIVRAEFLRRIHLHQFPARYADLLTYDHQGIVSPAASEARLYSVYDLERSPGAAGRPRLGLRGQARRCGVSRLSAAAQSGTNLRSLVSMTLSN
jgi:hypothetical protein